MKNMFFVVNKEKVYAYVVSILTIVILFFMSHVLNSDVSNFEESSTNTIEEEQLVNTTNNTGVSGENDGNLVKETLTDIVPN